jgi:UDPglucose 6-dehydrogenase
MNGQKPTITIIGCGYVGLTTAAILSNCGFKVYALEINSTRLNAIKKGRSFFFEAGIDPLIAKGVRSGNLIPTDTYDEAMANSSIVFSCVGTPDNSDGSSNLSYVFQAAEQTAALIAPGTIFVQKSTVPVGTGVRVEKVFKKAGKDIRYVSNPEFLRESTAVIDTLWFDRIVCGSNDRDAAQAVLDVYREIENCHEQIAQVAGLQSPKNIPVARYISTTRNSAELIKVTANAFLALKISFANSIAKLADKADGDVDEVMDAVGADRRIGRAFLNAGRGFGGGCFPKDVSGLIRSAQEYGVDMEIMNAAAEVNNSMPHYIINKAKVALAGSFEGKKCTVLGLSFKAGTSDTRRSPAIAIANTLLGEGATVHAYDPESAQEAKADLAPAVVLDDSLTAALQDAECVFIATDWHEFKEFDWSQVQTKLLVDAMNCLDKTKLPSATQYMGVGKN